MNWMMLGVLMVSLATTYAWWCRVRVINLRQDIFDIRDRLFDEAVALGEVDDPAHQDARAHLNRLATAKIISIPVLGYLSLGVSAAPHKKAANFKLGRAIDSALDESAKRVFAYLIHDARVASSKIAPSSDTL